MQQSTSMCLSHIQGNGFFLFFVEGNKVLCARSDGGFGNGSFSAESATLVYEGDITGITTTSSGSFEIGCVIRTGTGEFVVCYSNDANRSWQISTGPATDEEVAQEEKRRSGAAAEAAARLKAQQ